MQDMQKVKLYTYIYTFSFYIICTYMSILISAF